MKRRSRNLGLAGLSLLLCACGGGGTAHGTDAAAVVDAGVDAAMPDAALAPDLGFPTGPHEAAPQVPNLGGTVLHHPALVTVTFANEAHRDEFEAFAAWVVGSQWLLAAGAEYGVGAGTVGGAVQLQVTPPAKLTLPDIELFLATGILDGSIPKPPGGLSDALYLVHYPSTTSITASGCNRMLDSCVVWGGLHSSGHLMGLDFAFAVLPDCGSKGNPESIATFEQIASHEIIEAATDAFPMSNPAYRLRADPTDPWFGFFGSCVVEVGDLCEVPALTTTEGGHTVQRSWSNAAAAAGADPCVPADPAHPYFNTTGAPATVQRVAAGSSVKFDLHGFSVAPVPDWAVKASVFSDITGGPVPGITATPNPTKLNNGASAMLTVAVQPGVASGTTGYVLLESTHTVTTRIWVLGVTVP